VSLTAFVVAGVLALPAASALHAPAPKENAGPAVLDKVDVEEKLGNQVSLDLPFYDTTNQKVTLRDLLTPGDFRPTVLVLAYYRCPTLCSLVLGGVAQAVKDSGLVLGKDFRVVTVSIDPKETTRLALERKRLQMEALGRPETDPSWSYWVGEGDAPAKLAKDVGFQYAYDPDTKQYAHAAVIALLTPEGKISRYLYGARFPGRDFKLALIEASEGRVGTSFDRVLIKCFKYDPATRRYGVYLSNFVRGGAFLVFGALAAMLGVLWRRDVKRGTV